MVSRVPNTNTMDASDSLCTKDVFISHNQCRHNLPNLYKENLTNLPWSQDVIYRLDEADKISAVKQEPGRNSRLELEFMV